MEKHALGSIDPEPVKEFGVFQRQFNHFPDLGNGVFDPSQVFVHHGRYGLFGRNLHGLGQEFDISHVRDLHDPGRRGRDHLQLNFPEPE